MIEDLKDKCVLITGSSSGIGASIARAFGAYGARVAVHYNANSRGAADTVHAIRELGGEAISIRANLEVDGEQDELIEATWAAWDGIDILINNAGTVHKSSILDCSVEDWDRTQNLNVRAPYQLSRHLAQRLISEKRAGCILHNSSIHGIRSAEFFSAYAASKAALNSLTAVQALEWAPHNIRVNAVAPGVVPVERSETKLVESRDLWLPSIPLGRFGNTDDIANLCLFLCSDAAEWITGQVFPCDGGTLARINLPRRTQADL